MAVEFSRGWLLLHLGTQTQYQHSVRFPCRLMDLPIAYFDTKLNGDILQRIDDNSGLKAISHLQAWPSSFPSSISWYSVWFWASTVFRSSLFSSQEQLLYMLYVTLFMPSRERLDNVRFMQMAESGNKMINIVNGMQEIKLAGNEAANRREWEAHQKDIYRTRVRGLKILQFQTAGGTLIHESANIIITVISATSGHQRFHDPGDDACGTVHHRPAERTCITDNQFHECNAGCPDKP